MRSLSTSFPFYLFAALFWCGMATVPVWAQQYAFHRINVKDGLSHSSVLDIAKDETGLMWFATRYGLNRYDGVRFTVYEHNVADSNSIVNNYINRLFKDADGRLWIGTQGGLDAYDYRNDRFVHYPFYRRGARLPSASVLALAEDRQGNLWVGTDKGLFVRRPGADSCQEIAAGRGRITTHQVTELFVDRRGLLWVATTEGLALFRVMDQRLISQQLPFDPEEVRGSVRSIAEDDFGQLWLGSETEGVYRVRIGDRVVTPIAASAGGLLHNSVRKILVSRSNRLIIGTQNGVSVLDPLTMTFENYRHNPHNPGSLSQNSVYSLYEDQQRSLWVGTYFGGISLAYGIDTKFYCLTTGTSPVSLPHNVIKQISEDANGNLWCGTEGGGVFRLNAALSEVTHFYNPRKGLLGPRSNLVKAVHVDRSGDVWVGTSGGGFYLLDQHTGRFQQLSMPMDTLQLRQFNILSIYQDTVGYLWICGEGWQNGVYARVGDRLLDVTPESIKERLRGLQVVQLSEAHDKKLWILTSSAVFRYSAPGGLTQLLARERPPLHAFNCVLEDHRGLLWIGLDHGGLLVVDPQADTVVRHYTVDDGLASDNVVGVIEDGQGNLWITTTNGLSKVTKDRRTIQNYSRFDGLADDEFNYTATFLAADGKVLLGSLGGLTWFYPEQIGVNSNKPRLIFTGLSLPGTEAVRPLTHPRILDRNITHAPHLTFAADQRVFTIRFALDNYIKAAQNRFAYRLGGQGEPWTYIDKGEVSFSNLSPGRYTLAVKGANSDGIWSSESTLTITVRPPFYWTWWAILTYCVLMALFIFFIARYFYLRRVLEKEEELHRNKLNFFSMISHEIRTHLSLIIIPIENSLERVSDSYVTGQLKDAAKNSERLLRLTSELIDFRKAETANLTLTRQNIDIRSFIDEIFGAFRNVYQSADVTFEHQSAFIHHPVAFDPIQLEKVLFNLLSNAVKHSVPDSTIRVNSYLNEGRVVIAVSNSGKPIPKAYMEKIFENFFQVSQEDRQLGFGMGLALSRQIMKLHGGDIRAESENGITTFTVTLPDRLVAQRDKQEVPEEQLDEQLFYTDDGDRPTLLLIEDNPELMALLETFLKEHYTLLKSKNGKEGVELAMTHVPDLIVSDVMMPLKSGVELCRELKGNMATSHIPIVLLTAMNAESDFVNGLHHNADVYLTKPFNKQVLLLHIRNLLRSNRLMQKKYRQEYILAPTRKVVDTADEQFLAKVVTAIEKGVELSRYSVNYISEEVGMSASVLYKKVKSLTGMTVNDFSKHIRLKKAAQIMTDTTYTVSEAASYVGFTDSKYFSREFKKLYGVNPSEYKSA
jgi:Signal transduction histidine kinase